MAHQKKVTRLLQRSIVACTGTAMAALIAACGGGSGTTAVTPPAATLTVTGVAATGAAIAGRPVEAKCNGGTASGTTAADGSYTLTLTAGTLPCVLRVTLADGSALHSLASGTGVTAQGNITPVSELVVSQATAGTAAAYFTSFDAAAATALTPAKVDAAVASVIATLKDAGVDFSTSGNILTATLVPATTTTAGNAFDKALDALKAKLTSTGTTLATLATTVAATSPAAPVAVLSNTASLPSALLLKPKAANCPALRTGKYRLVVASVGTVADPNTTLLTLNAETGAIIDSNNPNGGGQITANGTCKFKTNAGADFIVSDAGIGFVAVEYDATTFQGAIAIPEQSFTVADLAGDWNLIGFDSNGPNNSKNAVSYSFSLDSTGKVSNVTFCDAVNTLCTNNVTVTINLSVNTAGGFNVVNSTFNETSRLFAYRAGGGELMLVQVYPNGRFAVGTRNVAATLPAVGRLSEGTSYTINSNLTTAKSFGDFKNTVRTVDTATNSFLRDNVTNLTTGVTRPETFTINSPRSGYSRRAPGTVTQSDASSSTVPEFVAMTVRGMGFSMVAFPSSNQVNFSVNKATP